MPPGQEIIDLTLSDSENEQAPPPKRPRAAPVDDEVVIVESGHASPAKNNELDTDEILGDNEVKLVSVTGEVSMVDACDNKDCLNSARSVINFFPSKIIHSF